MVNGYFLKRKNGLTNAQSHCLAAKWSHIQSTVAQKDDMPVYVFAAMPHVRQRSIIFASVLHLKDYRCSSLRIYTHQSWNYRLPTPGSVRELIRNELQLGTIGSKSGESGVTKGWGNGDLKKSRV